MIEIAVDPAVRQDLGGRLPSPNEEAASVYGDIVRPREKRAHEPGPLGDKRVVRGTRDANRGAPSASGLTPVDPAGPDRYRGGANPWKSRSRGNGRLRRTAQ